MKVHIETAEAAAALALDDIALADVVPGQYEGGAAALPTDQAKFVGDSG